MADRTKRVEGKTIWFCTKHDGGYFGVVQSSDITNERGIPIRHAFDTDEDLEMHKKYVCSFVSKCETRQLRRPQQQMVAMTPKLNRKGKPIWTSVARQSWKAATPCETKKSIPYGITS